MDGTSLYTLSANLHFKTVKISWHIQLKLLRKKKKVIPYKIQQAFTLLNLIYIYICLIYVYLLSNGVDILLILRFSRSCYDTVVILRNRCWYSLNLFP